MNEKTLYLMCGVPGSGKSYYAKKLAAKENIKYVSRDEIRFSLLKDGEDYFAHEDEVVLRFEEAIRNNVETTGSCIADASHLTVYSRTKTINAVVAAIPNVKVVIIYMQTSLKTCIERNKMREGRACVPEKVIRKMWYFKELPDIEDNKSIKEVKFILEGDEP